MLNPHSWLLVDVEPGRHLDDVGLRAEGLNTLLQAKIRRSDFAPERKSRSAGSR